MYVSLASIPVQDQDRAKSFYVEVLGFQVKHDIDMGGGARWLTLVSPDAPDGVELLLEPLGFAPAAVYQKALREAGIPWTQLASRDIASEYQRLLRAGVVFRSPPAQMGPVTVATFEDTCGNLIQLVQPGAAA